MLPALVLPDGRTLPLDRAPLLMGVVNVTPDSFSDGGLFATREAAIAQARKLAADGAAILDIGGELTRPGHVAIEAATEIARVRPVIEGLSALGVPLSIDSWKGEVVRASLAAGAQIVNDVWGCQRDEGTARAAAEAGAPLIAMHNRDSVDASLDMLSEVLRFLEASIAIATRAGVPRGQIVVDPGIGFGKTPEQNLLLIREIATLRDRLGCAVLLGASRKSTIGRITGQAVAAERVVGSIAAHLYGVAEGASIIRAHDIAEHRQALAVWRTIDHPEELPT